MTIGTTMAGIRMRRGVPLESVGSEEMEVDEADEADEVEEVGEGD